MIDANAIIQTFGYVGVFITIFIETGTPLGFVLPGGDSFLFVSGLFAGLGFLDIRILILGTTVSTFFGYYFGYYVGKKYGIKAFQDPRIPFLKEEYIESASLFFQKHGAKSLIVARFIPVVRTLTPVLAGAASMQIRQFLIFNALGSFLWVFSLQGGAFYLGSIFPRLKDYVHVVVLLILLLSIVPALYSFLKNDENRKKVFEIFKK
jgi:membrane-associated protein